MSSKIQGYSVPKAPEQNKSDKYKKISQTKALNEDFQIKIIFIGESGAGKSSLINMIINLLLQKNIKELIVPSEIETTNANPNQVSRYSTITSDILFFSIKLAQLNALLIDTPGFIPQMKISTDNLLSDNIYSVIEKFQPCNIILTFKSDQMKLNSSILNNYNYILSKMNENKIEYKTYIVYTFYAGSLEFESSQINFRNIKMKKKINNKFFKLDQKRVAIGKCDDDFKKIACTLNKVIDSFKDECLKVTKEQVVTPFQLNYDDRIKVFMQDPDIDVIISTDYNLICIECKRTCINKISIDPNINNLKSDYHNYFEIFRNGVRCTCAHHKHDHYVAKIKLNNNVKPKAPPNDFKFSAPTSQSSLKLYGLRYNNKN